ncbi:MAG: CHAD domain-containing protein [Pseudonocardiaceae bacterium]|nr:CHAD domain-containing protein [Pseudonocardiaceae bacterium]
MRAHSRGHQLVPVAHTKTTITRRGLADADGAVRARLTAHAVSAQTLGESSTVDSWYWIAVELDAPDPTLLGALEARLDDVGAMRAAPALPMRRLFADRLDGLKPSSRPRVRLHRKATAAETVCAALRAQVRALRDLDAPVRRAEPDAVHQMRVATRRLRAMLRAFGQVVDRDATADLYAELRWLSGVLAEARDQEVVQQRVEALLHDTPADQVLGPIAAQLTRQFARDQAEAHARVLDELDTDRYATLLDALERLVSDPPLTPLAARRGRDLLPRMVGKVARRVDRAMAAADREPEGPERDAALHGVRKAARRARYAAETVVPLLGGDARRTAQRFEQMGDVLGDHHDTVRTRALLRTLGAQGHGEGHNGFTFGLWHEREAHAAQRIEAELPAIWRAASRGKQRRWMS